MGMSGMQRCERGWGTEDGAGWLKQVRRLPAAKALDWARTDTERRQLKDRMGLNRMRYPSSLSQVAAVLGDRRYVPRALAY